MRVGKTYVLTLVVIALSGLVSGCIVPRKVGGYPVTGTVVDRCTGAPLDGVTVYLRYEAMNMFGPRQLDGEPVLTNQLGQFYIPARTVTMMGGPGGLGGSTDKWPDIIIFKDGYGPRPGGLMRASVRGKAPLAQDYRDLILTLLKHGENCPASPRIRQGTQAAP
jgi:hypothetical protein